MFGYACDETPELMPMPIILAHQRIMRTLTDLRKARQDARGVAPRLQGQVSVEYDKDGKPSASTPSSFRRSTPPHVSEQADPEEIIEKVIKTSVPAKLLDKRTVYHVNRPAAS